MPSFFRFCALALMALLFGSATLSCGDGSEDVVYVYAFNGYSGGGKLSIFSSAGQIAEGLAFGESSETPLALDRTRFNGQINILISGGQSQVVNFDAFALYPNESVTIAVNRKTNRNSYEFVVLRHHVLKGQAEGKMKSESPFQCATQIYNTLSLSNALSSGDQRYDIGTEWYFDQLKNGENLVLGLPVKRAQVAGNQVINYDAYVYESAAFLNDSGYAVDGQCGAIPLGSLASDVKNQIIAQRSAQLAQVAASPWLYLVTLGGGADLAWRWGNWSGQRGGLIEGIPSTNEFRQCITGAISYRETVMSGDQECPDPSTAELDANVFEQCLTFSTYTIQPLQPGGMASSVIYFNPFEGDPNTCSGTFRLRTRAVDSIFDADTNNFVEVRFENPIYQWQYMLIYGSPFNPGVHFLKADSLKADLRTIDNPGDLRFNGRRQSEP